PHRRSSDLAGTSRCAGTAARWWSCGSRWPRPRKGRRGTTARRRSGRPAALGQPRLAQLAALLLGGASPDACFLVGDQGELEARGLRFAGGTDPLGRRDLVDRRSCGADGEEKVGIGIPAGGEPSPVVGVPFDRPV